MHSQMKKTETIRSLQDFESIIKSIRERRAPQVLGLEPFKQEYFRGQSKDIKSYKLRPYIARKINSEDLLKQVEEQYLRNFRILIKGFKKEHLIRQKIEDDNTMDNYPFFLEWEWIWQAQHFELPTRLMDWTLDFKTALFFAVGNPQNDQFNGQLWVLFVEEKYQPQGYSYLNYSPFEYDQTKLINPYFNENNNFDEQIGELRRLRQNSVFLFQGYKNSLVPLEEQNAFMLNIEKYVIPFQCKPKIRTELLRKNYSVDRLLPKIEKKIKSEIEKIIHGS